MNTRLIVVTPSRRRSLTPITRAVVALLCVSFARAQTAPTLKPEIANDAVTLTPFTVSAEKDVGFVAASSLAGGRIATALKDTPVAYSVVTAEFLEAFNLTDVAEATQWSVNSTVVDADGTNRAFGTSVGNGGLRTRGVSTGLPTRNFFPYITTADSYKIGSASWRERV
jgi:outer membrane receptor for ferric coprogen and ferric-rhodotorulic acid